MDKKILKNTKSRNTGQKNNSDLKTINYNINFRRCKIKPRNIFNNNKLFAYQKASGNVTLLKKLIHQTFVEKYYHDKNFYNSKVIGDIINNESTHIVAEFKDYLIYGDDSEFFQKIYSTKECRKYLPKIFNYYESCSVIFPNYVILPESKYIYKNIQKKQKVIDLQQEQEEKKEKIKNVLINEKGTGGKNNDYNLFNTKAMDSILGQTNTSNINKIFDINCDNKNEKNENSVFMLNNIINELDNIEVKKVFQKKKINLIKKKCRIPSLNLNNTKGLMKQFNMQKNEKEKDSNEKEKNKNNNYKKKTYLIINKQNNNIKHFHIKKKSLSKKNDIDKSNLILNKKIIKENFLTNENTNHKIYSKIPKSKLSIDLEGVKRHMKMKSNLNNQEIYNQKGISFFNDILKKKISKRKNSKNNISMGKSSSNTRKKVNSFIPSQKQLLRLINADKNIQKRNSIKKKKKNQNQKNYSSPTLVKPENSKKSDMAKQKIKVPNIHIKDSNSSSNLLQNNYNLTSSRSRSIIRRRIVKKSSEYMQDNNYNGNLTNNKEITSESNINININTLPITDRDKSEKKIFFTIVPHINNMINLNKIKYMMRASSKKNIGINEAKSYKNDKISKNIKNKLSTKSNMVYKKNFYCNKSLNSQNIKKKQNSIKISYKSSNTQVSSSIGTAACSFGKNSYLMDFETIKVYQKRSYPYPNLIKPKNINAKNKYNIISQRKFSLSPDKFQSKELIKKMLRNNPISKEKYNKNKINSKRVPLYENNKKQKNVVLPIRKEKEQSELKIKDMIYLILNNKNVQNNYGNISRNSKIKHSKEKSSITISNKTSCSINTSESIKKSMLSLKNSNSNKKNRNKHIFPNNKTYYGFLKNNK